MKTIILSSVVGVLACAMIAAPAGAATVSNAAQLTAALRAATGGQTIQLASGNYGAVVIRAKPASMVTIQGHPSGHVVFTALTIEDSANLTVTGVEVDESAANADNTLLVYGSANIVLDRLKVHGPLTGDLAIAHGCVLLRRNTNVTFQNSEVYRCLDGPGHLDNDGLTIQGNDIHDIGNYCYRGAGSGAVQGLPFMGNELRIRYRNVVIADNKTVGMGITCVGLGTAQNVDVERNTCQPYIDTSVPHNSNNEINRIMLSDILGPLTVTGNRAQSYGTRDNAASVAKVPDEKMVTFDMKANRLLSPIRAPSKGLEVEGEDGQLSNAKSTGH